MASAFFTCLGRPPVGIPRRNPRFPELGNQSQRPLAYQLGLVVSLRCIRLSGARCAWSCRSSESTRVHWLWSSGIILCLFLGRVSDLRCLRSSGVGSGLRLVGSAGWFLTSDILNLRRLLRSLLLAALRESSTRCGQRAQQEDDQTPVAAFLSFFWSFTAFF